jgi:hypothetical protein
MGITQKFLDKKIPCVVYYKRTIFTGGEGRGRYRPKLGRGFSKAGAGRQTVAFLTRAFSVF